MRPFRLSDKTAWHMTITSHACRYCSRAGRAFAAFDWPWLTHFSAADQQRNLVPTDEAGEKCRARKRSDGSSRPRQNLTTSQEGSQKNLWSGVRLFRHPALGHCCNGAPQARRANLHRGHRRRSCCRRRHHPVRHNAVRPGSEEGINTGRICAGTLDIPRASSGGHAVADWHGSRDTAPEDFPRSFRSSFRSCEANPCGALTARGGG